MNVDPFIETPPTAKLLSFVSVVMYTGILQTFASKTKTKRSYPPYNYTTFRRFNADHCDEPFNRVVETCKLYQYIKKI
jgi:hypothetical protein